MGLITTDAIIKWNSSNKKDYVAKGYKYTKMKDEFIVPVIDLSDGCNTQIEIQCDGCKEILTWTWHDYKRQVKEDDKTYCHKCARKLYGGENVRKSRLKNSDKSFKKWCINNDRQDVLDRWNYDLNDKTPDEIGFSSIGTNGNGYWFKCLEHPEHGSELKKIKNFISGEFGVMDCKQCNTFEQWCLDNNHQDILDRWDYDKNQENPSEIPHGVSDKKYWFKCPRGIHESELKNISNFTGGREESIVCKMCNSFAQWGIDNISEDFLEKYWDYEKNDELNINPWKLTKCCREPKVWIICQKKRYHESYDVNCASFSMKESRCPYCKGNKVHLFDSIGQLLKDRGMLNIWSDRNEKSPFEYSIGNPEEVWWKCPDGKHKDFYRSIKNSNMRCDFRCPECGYSKGEKKIEEYLVKNNFTKTIQQDYEKLSTKDINENKYYIPQKTFKGLLGVNKGLLSYDFYLPEYNILIEYQGEFHDGSGDMGNYYMKQNLEKQQEHDKRKKQYAEDNKIKLLEIWYYEFDNIEEILRKELNSNKLKEVI